MSDSICHPLHWLCLLHAMKCFMYPDIAHCRLKRRGWMKKLAVTGAVAGVGCLLHSFRR